MRFALNQRTEQLGCQRQVFLPHRDGNGFGQWNLRTVKTGISNTKCTPPLAQHQSAGAGGCASACKVHQPPGYAARTLHCRGRSSPSWMSTHSRYMSNAESRSLVCSACLAAFSNAAAAVSPCCMVRGKGERRGCVSHRAETGVRAVRRRTHPSLSVTAGGISEEVDALWHLLEILCKPRSVFQRLATVEKGPVVLVCVGAAAGHESEVETRAHLLPELGSRWPKGNMAATSAPYALV